MSNKTRKRIWPVSMGAAIGVVAMLAMLAATMWMPGNAQAQTAPVPPSAPQSLAAAPTSGAESTSITLTWTAPRNFANTVTGYELERHAGDGTFAAVSPGPSGNVLTYNDTGLTAETTYSYRVAAVNVNGAGSYLEHRHRPPRWRLTTTAA